MAPEADTSGHPIATPLGVRARRAAARVMNALVGCRPEDLIADLAADFRSARWCLNHPGSVARRIAAVMRREAANFAAGCGPRVWLGLAAWLLASGGLSAFVFVFGHFEEPAQLYLILLLFNISPILTLLWAGWGWLIVYRESDSHGGGLWDHELDAGPAGSR